MIEGHGETRRITVGGRPATEIEVDGLTVVVDAGPDRGKTATLSGTSLTVGTDRTADLVLTDTAVSRRHLVMVTTPEGVRVEDQGSTNGTWLGSTRLESAIVGDGALLTVGESRLRVRAGGEAWVVIPDESGEFEGMVGSSAAMREIFALVRQLARTDLPVLVTGETGTGKELVARALHASGPRRSRPFQLLDCGSVVPDLLRSELFGHEKGAFTGAVDAAPGILEAARGGSVFLDEIGEIPAALQPGLLRAVESREVRRIGARKSIPVDFRIVAATNRDLKAEVAAGRFRADLYYRLSCVTIRLPALSARREDVALLARRFLEDCALRHGLEVPGLEPDAIESLERHDWPGNVRELRNTMDRLCVFASGRAIGRADVRRAVGEAQATASRRAAADSSALDRAEAQVILEALEATRWNRKAAARRLGIAASTIFEKIKKYGLVPPEKGA